MDPPQRPLAEFVAADDYEETRDLVAVIRGSDSGRRMCGTGDALRRGLHGTCRTQLYSERVVHRACGNKVVVAREDEDATMLNHALIRAGGATRRRRKTLAASCAVQADAA